jgi:hypothetical protein
MEQRERVWNRTIHPLFQVYANQLTGAWGYDCSGRQVRFSDYGNRSSQYGWELDHIIPLSARGSDDESNLQALHWEVNVEKSDKLIRN